MVYSTLSTGNYINRNRIAVKPGLFCSGCYMLSFRRFYSCHPSCVMVYFPWVIGMEKNWKEVQEKLQSLYLPEWSSLPDFGLYMDQLVTFVQRCFVDLTDSEIVSLTPSMINNYVKAGLIDRPAGKKYSRSCLAQLLMICELKQTTPLSTMQKLLHPDDSPGTEAIYEAFRISQKALLKTMSNLPETDALTCALEAASYQLLCRMLTANEKEQKKKRS